MTEAPAPEQPYKIEDTKPRVKLFERPRQIKESWENRYKPTPEDVQRALNRRRKVLEPDASEPWYVRMGRQLKVLINPWKWETNARLNLAVELTDFPTITADSTPEAIEEVMATALLKDGDPSRLVRGRAAMHEQEKLIARWQTIRKVVTSVTVIIGSTAAIAIAPVVPVGAIAFGVISGTEVVGQLITSEAKRGRRKRLEVIEEKAPERIERGRTRERGQQEVERRLGGNQEFYQLLTHVDERFGNIDVRNQVARMGLISFRPRENGPIVNLSYNRRDGVGEIVIVEDGYYLIAEITDGAEITIIQSDLERTGQTSGDILIDTLEYLVPNATITPTGQSYTVQMYNGGPEMIVVTTEMQHAEAVARLANQPFDTFVALLDPLFPRQNLQRALELGGSLEIARRRQTGESRIVLTRGENTDQCRIVIQLPDGNQMRGEIFDQDPPRIVITQHTFARDTEAAETRFREVLTLELPGWREVTGAGVGPDIAEWASPEQLVIVANELAPGLRTIFAGPALALVGTLNRIFPALEIEHRLLERAPINRLPQLRYQPHPEAPTETYELTITIQNDRPIYAINRQGRGDDDTVLLQLEGTQLAVIRGDAQVATTFFEQAVHANLPVGRVRRRNLTPAQQFALTLNDWREREDIELPIYVPTPVDLEPPRAATPGEQLVETLTQMAETAGNQIVPDEAGQRITFGDFDLIFGQDERGAFILIDDYTDRDGLPPEATERWAQVQFHPDGRINLEASRTEYGIVEAFIAFIAEAHGHPIAQWFEEHILPALGKRERGEAPVALPLNPYASELVDQLADGSHRPIVEAMQTGTGHAVRMNIGRQLYTATLLFAQGETQLRIQGFGGAGGNVHMVTQVVVTDAGTLAPADYQALARLEIAETFIRRLYGYDGRDPDAQAFARWAQAQRIRVHDRVFEPDIPLAEAPDTAEDNVPPPTDVSIPTATGRPASPTDGPPLPPWPPPPEDWLEGNQATATPDAAPTRTLVRELEDIVAQLPDHEQEIVADLILESDKDPNIEITDTKDMITVTMRTPGRGTIILRADVGRTTPMTTFDYLPTAGDHIPFQINENGDLVIIVSGDEKYETDIDTFLKTSDNPGIQAIQQWRLGLIGEAEEQPIPERFQVVNRATTEFTSFQSQLKTILDIAQRDGGGS